MSNFGITQEGFKRKTYLELLEEVETRLKNQDAFGENIDFTENDPLYQFTVPYVMALSELWEVAEHTFYSASPKFAEGNNLKNVGKYIGIAGKQSTKAYGENIQELNGDKDSIIRKGLQVATENGITFETTKTVTIGEDGKVLVDIVAIQAGNSGNVPSGTITQIVNPTIGLKSTTNIDKTIGGQDAETDIEFRDRYSKSTAQRATNIFDSIRANVLKTTGVKDVLLINNNTMEQVNGVPPKSFHTIVLGGDDKNIAQSIFEKFPAGIQPFGNIIIDVEDSRGMKQPIGFSRPSNQDIWFKIKIVKNEDFPEDGDDIIKNMLNDYIKTFIMGQDVILYKIICTIGIDIKGIADIEIETSTDGIVYSANNVSISDLKVATTSLEKIEVIQ